MGEWKVAPLRRDILVLTVGWPDALEGVGVRAEDVVFVVRRGWLNDMLSGQVCVDQVCCKCQILGYC